MERNQQLFLRLTFLIATLCVTSIMTAQFTPIADDFEGNGSITSWEGDECNVATNFPNPLIDADNPSATVLEYYDTGSLYANARFTLPQNINMTTGTTFTLSVYVPSAGLTGTSPNQVSLKLQSGYKPNPWTTQTEIIKPIVLDQWQTLSFDFSSGEHVNFDQSSPAPWQRVDLNRVLIQINGENNNDQVLAYIDNLQYNGQLGYDPDNTSSEFDELVWSDEFDVNGPVDEEKWFHQTQLPNSWGWFNGEQQHYTDDDDNSYVEDGSLHIVARIDAPIYFGQVKQQVCVYLWSC